MQQPVLRQRTVAVSSWNTKNQAAVRYVVLIGLAVIFLAPFVWLVGIALKGDADLAAFPIHWVPQVPQWNNFVLAVTTIDFWRYALDSVIISGIYTISITFTSASVGFAFARLRAPGKQVLLLIMLSTIMLPPILTVIPTFVIFTRLNLIGTYWPWVLWGLSSSPFLSFLFRQFFSVIPKELEEAAIIDGASYGGIFWRIFLPLSKPAIVTAAILSFSMIWGDYITPAIFLTQSNTTLSVAVAGNYVNGYGIQLVNITAAGTVLYILPVLIVFFFAQRAFVRGVVTTGLK
jgi:multiple sugar transport system permease protein